MSAVVASFINDESARPTTQLKQQFTTDIFIDQVHKFQNSYFNPIQNGCVGGKKKTHTSFSPVTSTNLRASPPFLTFSFNLFATLV